MLELRGDDFRMKHCWPNREGALAFLLIATLRPKLGLVIINLLGSNSVHLPRVLVWAIWFGALPCLQELMANAFRQGFAVALRLFSGLGLSKPFAFAFTAFTFTWLTLLAIVVLP